MKKVEILPGCISCGTCEQACPKVFEVRDIACVKEGVDIEKNMECILEAKEICPVDVIKIKEESL